MKQTVIVQAILSQPQANRRVAYVYGYENGRIDYVPEELDISEALFGQMHDELPVVYEEEGYAAFNIDEQLKLARELDETHDDFLAGTGRG